MREKQVNEEVKETSCIFVVGGSENHAGWEEEVVGGEASSGGSGGVPEKVKVERGSDDVVVGGCSGSE